MIKKLFIVACGALALASCAEKESKIVTDSGLEIDVINGGTDEIDPGMTLLVDFVVKTTDDSVLMSTVSEGLPRPARKVDSIWRGNAGGIEEVIFNLKNKDSVCFNISADKLYGHVTPPGIEKETMLKVNMAVREAMTNEDFQSYRMQKIQEMEAEQLNMDVDIIDAYLEENGISAQKTDSGLHYIITEEGEGANVQVGDVITANYSGYVLNGPYFDSSIEEVAKDNGIYQEGRTYEPFQTAIGQGRVIKGWDEGFQLLNKGAKATFYIPSPLAYGARARSKEIGPNSILVFDVELIDIESGSEEK